MTKILYVEDNEDNVYMLKLRLEKKGYEVIIASNGLEGVNKAREEKPDLIIMDVGLQIMDGHQATKIIKSDPVMKAIPIIVLTAHAMVTDEEKARKAGAEDFETKPVDVLKLIGKIEKLLMNKPIK